MTKVQKFRAAKHSEVTSSSSTYGQLTIPTTLTYCINKLYVFVKLTTYTLYSTIIDNGKGETRSYTGDNAHR